MEKKRSSDSLYREFGIHADPVDVETLPLAKERATRMPARGS